MEGKDVARRAVALALALATIASLGCAPRSDRVVLEIRIQQNMDQILFSDFGEPPQTAIWLEDPATHRLRTVFVTWRSGAGEWKGKSECPPALPRWFQVYRTETGRKGLPTPQHPAPDAVTKATPLKKHFAAKADVAPCTKWVCWIEVNISADFNEHFQQYDEKTQTMDTHFSGQPSLVYRAEITATPGERVVLTPYAYTQPDSPTGTLVRDLKPITTAKTLFKAIEITVRRPRFRLF